MINYKHDKDDKKPYYDTPENEKFWDNPKNPNPNAKMSNVTADFLNSVNTELRELVKLFGLTLGSDPMEGQLANFLKQFWQREQQRVGSILPLAYEPQANGDGSFPIQGYLPCQGAVVSRTTYSKLFSVIGTKYGAGDGTTTFTLPNYQGLFFRGHGGSGEHVSGNYGQIQGDELRSHNHRVGMAWGNTATGQFTDYFNKQNNWGFNTDSTGGAETRPVNTAVFYCIKHGEVE